MLTKLARWSRIKSPWILHLNSGACNACDIEIEPVISFQPGPSYPDVRETAVSSF